MFWQCNYQKTESVSTVMQFWYIVTFVVDTVNAAIQPGLQSLAMKCIILL